MPDPETDSQAAGLVFLLLTDPSDRALAGWMPEHKRFFRDGDTGGVDLRYARSFLVKREG